MDATTKKSSMRERVLQVRDLHKSLPNPPKPAPHTEPGRTLGFRQNQQPGQLEAGAEQEVSGAVAPPPSASTQVVWPTRSLGYEEATPVLFLLDNLTEKADAILARSNRLVEQLADAAGMQRFRRQPGWRQLTENGALRRIKTSHAKRAMLVVLTLLLKTVFQNSIHQQKRAEALTMQLRIEPIFVPEDVSTHQRLALAYFQK